MMDRNRFVATAIPISCHVLICEGLPGVYSTIWCLWYKTNKLKKKWKGERQAELNRPEKEAASGLGSCGVASGFAGGSSGRQPVTLS